MPRQLINSFILFSITAAVIAGLVGVDWAHVAESWRMMLLWVSVCFVAYHFVVDSGSRTGSGSWSMWLGAELFIYVTQGYSIALVAALGGLLVDDLLLKRKTLVDIVVNAGLASVPLAFLHGTFVATGGLSVPLALPGDYVTLLASTAVLAMAYSLMPPVIIIMFDESRPVRRILVDEALTSSPLSTFIEAFVGMAAAVVFMVEPWAVPVVLPLTVSILLAVRRQARVEAITESALESFANLVDERDRYTAEHSSRVCEYSMKIGHELGLRPKQLAALYWTSRLHDLGKVAVDNSILNKSGKLTDEEFEIMKSHPVVSSRILRSFSFNDYDADVVLCHHERFDGRGYLRRDPGTVPFEAFIIAVADTFDAMTSDRPYRRGLPREVAFAEIFRNMGTQFEPRAAHAFLTVMGYEFPVAEDGSAVATDDLRHEQLGSAAVDRVNRAALDVVAGGSGELHREDGRADAGDDEGGKIEGAAA